MSTLAKTSKTLVQSSTSMSSRAAATRVSARKFNSSAWHARPAFNHVAPLHTSLRQASTKILAADIMTPLSRKECVALPPTATAFDAAREMHTNDVGSVVIMSPNDKVIGIVTERDVVRRVLQHDVDPREMEISRVMTAYPQCARETHTLDQLIDFMLAANCRHIPVLGESKEKNGFFQSLFSSAMPRAPRAVETDNLVGMVSIRDIAETIHKMYRTEGGGIKHDAVQDLLHRKDALPSPHSTPASTNTPYYAVREGCSSSRALKLMAKKNVGALLVTDGNQPSGIVTERDFVRMMAEAKAHDVSKPIGEFGAPRSLISVTGEYQVERCLSILAKQRFRHLPVFEFIGDDIDCDSRCAGILSVRDLLRASF